MSEQWMLKGTNYVNCNCAYGCPCQFSSPSTYGFCQAVANCNIEEGYFNDIKLDGLALVYLANWPGEIAEGNGRCQVILDEQATDEQREALRKIAHGESTAPGATHFAVFASTMSEAFNSFGPVEWFSEQFADPSAASMFRLVLIAWAVLALVSIVLDRFGSLLLGRSRPLAQHPPERARAWRWGQRTPPENYSLLPPGIAGVPRLEPEVPIERPLALPPGRQSRRSQTDRSHLMTTHFGAFSQVTRCPYSGLRTKHESRGVLPPSGTTQSPVVSSNSSETLMTPPSRGRGVLTGR